MLLLAKKPALSVNGNVAALVPNEMVTLSNELKAPLEINLFHRTEERVAKISELLRNLGAEWILGENPDIILPGLNHARSKATRGGIFDADVVLIPLEDGDRCEALVKMGKKVIAIDLNPLSRTARTAKLTIVDNIVRAMPNLIFSIRELSGMSTRDLQDLLLGYDNDELLRQALFEIRKNLDRQIEVGASI
jgi:4-phosphopantoate--beta-alanine ligase